MEHYKISKISKYSTVFKLVTKKWIKVTDLLSGQYSFNKNITFKTSMLRWDLYGYSNAYNAVKRKISVRSATDLNKINKKLTFKNNVLFRSGIWKINNTFVDNAEDLDIVMLINNLWKYSSNYSITSGRLQIYYRDGVNDSANEIDDNDNEISITKKVQINISSMRQK